MRVIVETMPDIHKDAALSTEGADVRLTVVEPDSDPRGSIVLLHGSSAFSPSMLDFLQELADERWLVVAPDIEAPGLRTGIDATFEWVSARGIAQDRIGLLGFDGQGASAVEVAVQRSVGALVSVSPTASGEETLVELVGSLRAPWLALYGDDDPRTPPEDVEALRDATAGADAPVLVVSYEGLTHRPDEPPVGAGADPAEDAMEAATVDARRRIFDWFDTHLR